MATSPTSMGDFVVPESAQKEPTGYPCGTDGCSLVFGTARELEHHLDHVHWCEPPPVLVEPKLCLHCKARERGADGTVYCAPCKERFQQQEAERERQQIAQLRTDFGRWPVDLTRDRHNAAALDAIKCFPRGTDQQPNEDGKYWGGIFIWGPVGAGKSCIAYELAQDWIKTQGSARFVIVRDLFAKAKRAMSNGERTNPIDDLLDEQPSLLVIDDLGAERPTSYAVEEIARLVEHRYREDYSPSIVTSNYSPSQLAARFSKYFDPTSKRWIDDQITGQRIVSRLREDSLVIHLDGPDRRLQRGADTTEATS